MPRTVKRNGRGRTRRAQDMVNKLRVIPVIVKDINRMADWLNATGTVQVAIIEAVQSYIDAVQKCEPLDGFKLTDKVNAIVMAHVESQKAAQPAPITEPVKDEAGNAVDPATVDAVNALSEQISHATDPPST